MCTGVSNGAAHFCYPFPLMVVRDSLFDVLLFGVLALALALDVVFAHLQGIATLFAVGLATYCAAQEMSRALSRRRWWTQESLATSVALSALGFLYYFGRNESDIILVALSLTFMMTSLMLLIAFVAAISAAWHEKSGAPLLGWIMTFAGAVILGALAGMLVLVLTSSAPLAVKIALLVVGFAVAKMRAASQKKAPASDTSSTRNGVANNDASNDETRAAAVHAGGWSLMPERGTLLERFVPVLLIGALAFVVLSQINRNAAWPTTSAQAASSQAASAQNSISSP